MTRSRPQRGMTLLEVLVSVTVMVMISLLIYGAFESMSRGKKAEVLRTDRSRQGREAVERIARELQGAFLSTHQPQSTSLQTRLTVFVGQNQGSLDRLDFASFAHRRVDKEAHESDQAEVGYFVVKDPDVQDKKDLVRREQTPVDTYPQRGGVVNVVAEDIEAFDLRYLDPLTGTWSDSWDSTQVSGQLSRMPLEVKITLTLKPVKNDPPYTFSTKVLIPIREPLSFGISR